MKESLLALMAALALGCGPKPGFIPDAGPDDAGFDGGFDAGRPRGDDPPTGWQTALALPAGADAGTRLGASLASAPDFYGQPMVAGIYDDPNGDGQRDDTRLFFSRWDGVSHAFNAPQVVEVVGAIDLSHPHRQVSLARDAATGQLGIAYVKGTDTIRLATSSDEGANFTLEMANAVSAGVAVSDPQLAMAGGVVHLAWFQGGSLLYRTRTGTGAFTDVQVPLTPGMAAFVPGPLSVAVDAAGHVGLAYFESPNLAPMSVATLAFWRPGAQPTVVADSGAVDVLSGSDRLPSVSLSFAGEAPRLAYHLRKVLPLASADDTTELWYAQASDPSGATWAAPVGIPRNGDTVTFNSTRWYQAVAADATGRAAVAADFVTAGFTPAQCGGPKLSRAPDGATFTTCSPGTSPVHYGGDWISLWSHAPGKLTLLFYYDTRTTASLKGGVVMWREP
jgi:hypothetical protein